MDKWMTLLFSRKERAEQERRAAVARITEAIIQTEPDMPLLLAHREATRAVANMR